MIFNRFATKFIYHLLMILLLCSASPRKWPSPILKHELLQRPKLKLAQLNTEQVFYAAQLSDIDVLAFCLQRCQLNTLLPMKVVFVLNPLECTLYAVNWHSSQLRLRTWKRLLLHVQAQRERLFFSWIYELRLEGMRNLWNDSCSPIVHIIMPCTQVQIKIFMHLLTCWKTPSCHCHIYIHRYIICIPSQTSQWPCPLSFFLWYLVIRNLYGTDLSTNFSKILEKKHINGLNPGARLQWQFRQNSTLTLKLPFS